MMDDLSNIENFGIDLKLESEHMEEFYCETLRQWFMDPKGYVTISITDREFELEKDGELIGVVYIFDSILRLKPIKDDPVEALIDILEFVAKHHKATVNTYNYLSGNEEEADKILDFLSEQSEETDSVEAEEEVEEEDSDDWEWI
tara:strand:- start:15 stop:449 length:435 start_codon:yes stop_codon:yes gene_type:complete